MKSPTQSIKFIPAVINALYPTKKPLSVTIDMKANCNAPVNAGCDATQTEFVFMYPIL